MVLNIFSPRSPVFLVFPFDDLLNLKIPGIVIIAIPAAMKGIPNHAGKVDNPKSPSSNVNHRVPTFQCFPFGNPGGNAVKMNRLTGGLVGYGGGYVFDWLTAVRAEGVGDRFDGKLGGLPFGTIVEGQISFGITKEKPRQLIKTLPAPLGPFPGRSVQ
jgi:hypothetical protein